MRLPSPLLAARMRRNGIKHPVWTYQYAALHHVPLPVACAILMEESSGGDNVFGHDPTVAAGWGTVTKAKYLAYRHLRDASSPPRCQGVGPMQLTSRGLQQEADELGGCWKPRWNIAVGMHYLQGCLDAYPRDLHAGVARYNGSGPAAEAYATRVLTLADHFRAVLGV